MRQASAALETFLQSRLPCWKADLFTITLLSGAVFNWTDFDQPVTYSGTTWLSVGPRLQRSKLGVKNTVEVPELSIKLSAFDTDTVNGVNIKQQLHNGLFDGSSVVLQRMIMPTPGDTSLGTVTLFGGRCSNVQITAVGATLSYKGANVLMNQYAPRNLYETNCLHTFCDAGCTLLASSFTLTSQTFGSGSTSQQLIWNSPPGNQALYTFGMLTVTSGAANGQVRSVKLVSGGTITVTYPLYNAPASGDTFSILRGCDKTFNSGSGQSCGDYSNTQHYRGFPFVPPAYMAV